MHIEDMTRRRSPAGINMFQEIHRTFEPETEDRVWEVFFRLSASNIILFSQINDDCQGKAGEA